jgi:pilus assembly protein Flp/PilA
MNNFKGLSERLRSEEGQALVEYALVLGLIAVAVVAALTALGTDIQALLSRIDAALRSAV